MNMHSPPQEHLVVIGNGMAGMRTVEELLKRAPGRYRITVFGAEPHVNYDRILLSSVLAGEKDAAAIVIHPRSWYEDNNIELFVSDPVVSIDRAAKTVTAKSGRVESYDRLLLATGSRPLVPPRHIVIVRPLSWAAVCSAWKPQTAFSDAAWMSPWYISAKR
jgi:nitrite reductase (NADH) large subunit